MEHPDLPGSEPSTVSEKAFEEIWKRKGWKRYIPPKPEPEPELEPEEPTTRSRWGRREPDLEENSASEVATEDSEGQGEE
jgi:hypothetical protein